MKKYMDQRNRRKALSWRHALGQSLRLGVLASLCWWAPVAPAAPMKDAAAMNDAAPMSEAAQATAGVRLSEALQSPSAETAVDEATAEIMAFIRSAQGYASSDPERFFTEVEALMGPLIDFERFARNVMGAYYKAATPAQRSEFAESFKWSLVRTYALALTEFNDGDVRVVSPRRPPRDPEAVKVTQEIGVNGRTYAVVYDMRREGSAWRLRNMIIEGVNVGLNFKSQFASAMQGPDYNGDLDRVIAAWSRFVQGEQAAQVESGAQRQTRNARAANT